jgi:RimJ/RimL family protein N-acetyltransferase
MTIRELDPAQDAGQFVALIHATHPTVVTNAQEWLHRRRTIPERARMFSRVAEVDGGIVGAVEAGLNFFGSGDVASVGVRVDPDHRNRGIGSELYRLGMEHVRSLGATHALSMFDETDAGVAFATRRGWSETRAESLSSLDPRAVSEQPDPAVELLPARDLDPRELHRIDEEATRDMPAFDAVNEIDYDEWLDFVWDNPLFTRDGSFGAVVDGRVAAVSLLLANLDLGRAVNMFTGTSREHRRRGLALAVKLASTRWAAETGITQIVTTNDETNTAMLAVNRRLGYEPLGRRVEYVLDLERAEDRT